VTATLDRIINAAQGRIIVTSFASNILRLEQAIQVGARHGRKVAVVGRSMEQSVQVAMDLGYIKPPKGYCCRSIRSPGCRRTRSWS
jgi:ribonuclease J